MTRKEEIRQFALKRNYEGDFDSNDGYQGIIEGAQWADKHQRNPWRDAKKNPPKDDNQVFLSFQGIKCAGEYNNDEKLWYANGWGIVEPEYWMPIPETPKGGAK